MTKWIKLIIKPGLAGIGALMLALWAVWWVDPSPEGTALLFLIVFVLVLAITRLGERLVGGLRRRHARPMQTAKLHAPSGDSPESAEPLEVNRSREP